MNWAALVWIAVLVFYHENYEAHKSRIAWSYWVLILFFFGKLVEEVQQWNAMGSGKFGRKINIYFVDKWNFVDVTQLVSMFFYLVCGGLEELLGTLNAPAYSVATMHDINEITFMAVMVSSAVNLTQIFAQSKRLGNCIEATMTMASQALNYMVFIVMCWAGFALVGTTFIGHF